MTTGRPFSNETLPVISPCLSRVPLKDYACLCLPLLYTVEEKLALLDFETQISEIGELSQLQL